MFNIFRAAAACVIALSDPTWRDSRGVTFDGRKYIHFFTGMSTGCGRSCTFVVVGLFTNHAGKIAAITIFLLADLVSTQSESCSARILTSKSRTESTIHTKSDSQSKQVSGLDAL
jgi:hypothetical protein